MKILSLALGASLLFPCAFSQCPSMLWNDEFSGTALNTSVWSFQTGDGCDIGPDLCGWGNAELQWYRAENAVVSDGTLKIIAKEEDFNNYKFTSARIRTLNNLDIDMTQAHLRIEAHIKVPDGGDGLWPAFWMLPSDISALEWPTGGEIDIMEFIGREPNHTHGYLHYGNAFDDRVVKGGHLYNPSPPSEVFHEYAIEKKPGEISFFFDGHKYQTFTDAEVEPQFLWLFERDFHLILNVAVGGNWPEAPNELTNFPTQMEVDYIRIYDFSRESYGHITGARHVQALQGSELYCIEDGIDYESLSWEVPDGAQYTSVSETCISVFFGSTSGYVTAIAVSACGNDRQFQVPVKVEPFYEKEFAFVEPDSATDNIDALLFSSGSYVLETVDGQPAVRYERNINEPYDTIQYSTSAIVNPDLYLSDAFSFFMDVKTTTTPNCTHVLIQLEDSSLVTDNNYPIGRHSRHIAYMSDSRDWQRLQFEFYDQPDWTTTTVDRITILFDPNMARGDVYYFRNFDSDLKGCLSNCEPLPSNSCRQRAKSEAGACTDGINNNGLGYDANGLTDCADSSCWDDPACLVATTTDITETSTSSVPLTTTSLTSETTITPQTTTSATVAETTTTVIEMTTILQPTPSPVLQVVSTCSSNPNCAALNLVGPDCCPTTDNVYLYCCENFTPTPPAPTPVLPPAPNAGRSCSSNPQCARLNVSGDCCPTTDGVDLYCCEGYQPPVNNDPKCSAHASCAGLAGPNCCPTSDGKILECCDNYVPPN